jgi:CheY-like chemotaxis protein
MKALERNKIVLLVEDDPLDIELITQAFGRLECGENLRSARDAEEATAYVLGVSPFLDRSKYPLPSVILLDVKLPGRTGLQFLEWYRQRPESQGVPVIALTSQVDYSQVKRVFELGATSYITKPRVFEDLVEAIRTVITYWLVLNTWPQSC